MIQLSISVPNLVEFYGVEHVPLGQELIDVQSCCQQTQPGYVNEVKACVTRGSRSRNERSDW